MILPIIPLTMLLGFAMLVFQFIFPPLAIIFSWLAYLPLRDEVEVINFLASVKFSSMPINNFPWWAVAVWYILLFLLIFWLKKRQIDTKK